jgi:hypothetical protein
MFVGRYFLKEKIKSIDRMKNEYGSGYINRIGNRGFFKERMLVKKTIIEFGKGLNLFRFDINDV